MPPEDTDNTPQSPIQPPQQSEISPQQAPPSQFPPVNMPQNTTPTPPPAKTFPTKKLIIGLATLLVVILISAVGGYYLMNQRQKGSQNKAASTETVKAGISNEPADYIFVRYKDSGKDKPKSAFTSFDENFGNRKDFDDPELAKKINMGNCVSFSDKKTFACRKYEELPNEKTRYVLYLTNEGKETVLWEETVDYSSIEKAVQLSEAATFLELFGVAAVRNDNDIILSSNTGVAKFDIGAKKFSWIYKNEFPSSDESNGGIVYSKLMDSVYYAVHQSDFTPNQFDRTDSTHIVKVNLASSKGEKIWSKNGHFGFNGFTLSKGQDKLAFLINETYYNEVPKLFIEVIGLKDNSPNEIAFENKGGETKLLGFTHDEGGLLIFERNLKNVSDIKDTSVYIRLSVWQDNKKREIIKSDCDKLNQNNLEVNDCLIYALYDTLSK